MDSWNPTLTFDVGIASHRERIALGEERAQLKEALRGSNPTARRSPRAALEAWLSPLARRIAPAVPQTPADAAA